jgi:hypothetical protein
MNQKHVAENLAAVEDHFHSEAENEVAAALKLYTDDIVWEAPALNGLNRSYSGKEAVAKNDFRIDLCRDRAAVSNGDSL